MVRRKDRKDHYNFGIDFVECIKIVGFKIGNNVTQDDIWHPIYAKFEKVLNLWNSEIIIFNFPLAIFRAISLSELLFQQQNGAKYSESEIIEKFCNSTLHT
jgi:hypothetical protein